MKIIKTPWKNDFLKLVSDSKLSIKITSPYIKENVCDEMLLAKKESSKLEIVTSFKIANIHSGSLDIEALQKIINKKGLVKNLSKLHSKIYLFDDKQVIISSGNLTNGGLLNNFEYGIYSDDKFFVSKVIEDFEVLSNHSDVGEIKSSHLKEVRAILSKMPKSEDLKYPKINISEEKTDIIDLPISLLDLTLKGWKLEVFNCANTLNKEFFSLADIYQFESILLKKYPTNTRVLPKIRQQLQNLRDIGLIEFLGNGHYRKLWK